MRLKIANYHVQLSGIVYPEVVAQISPYMVDADGPADLFIQYAENNHIPAPKGSLCGPYRHCYYQNEPSGMAMYRISKGVEQPLLALHMDKPARHATMEAWNLEDLMDTKTYLSAQFMLAECFSYSYLLNKGFVLHGSAISYRGCGIVFSAASGTGKSTHTGLWKQFYPDVEIINDDAPAIYFDNQLPIICGTPFAGSSGINQNQQVPLKAVVFLERSKTNKMVRLSPTQAIPRLLDDIRKPILKPYMAACLERADKLLSTTPIYLLSCNISQEAVELVKQTLQI